MTENHENTSSHCEAGNLSIRSGKDGRGNPADYGRTPKVWRLASSKSPRRDPSSVARGDLLRMTSWLLAASRKLKAAISVFLALAMLAPDPSCAAGVSDFLRSNFSSDLRELSIPARLGTITDRWLPSPKSEKRRAMGDQGVAPLAYRSSPLVVLIQDLHANIGVQKNIAGILEHLYRRYGVSAFYTEAAFGSCEVSPFRILPSRRVQNELIDKLLAKAMLSGADIAAIKVGRGVLSPVKLEGVDDPLLYLANVQAFRDLVAVGPQIALEWRSTRDLLMPGAMPELRRHLELTEKLLSLKLVDYEWLEYKARRDWTPRGRADFERALAAAERFYKAAEARNGALAANLLAQIGGSSEFLPSPAYGERAGVRGSSNPSSGLRPPSPQGEGGIGGTRNSKLSAVALVTGGFHTASVAHVLKENGVPFAVVTPVVERLDQEKLYVQSLTEPPHETIAALDSLGRYIANLNPLADGLGMGNEFRTWITRRYTVSYRTVGKVVGGSIALAATVPWWLRLLEGLQHGVRPLVKIGSDPMLLPPMFWATALALMFTLAYAYAPTILTPAKVTRGQSPRAARGLSPGPRGEGIFRFIPLPRGERAGVRVDRGQSTKPASGVQIPPNPPLQKGGVRGDFASAGVTAVGPVPSAHAPVAGTAASSRPGLKTAFISAAAAVVVLLSRNLAWASNVIAAPHPDVVPVWASTGRAALLAITHSAQEAILLSAGLAVLYGLFRVAAWMHPAWRQKEISFRSRLLAHHRSAAGILVTGALFIVGAQFIPLLLPATAAWALNFVMPAITIPAVAIIHNLVSVIHRSPSPAARKSMPSIAFNASSERLHARIQAEFSRDNYELLDQELEKLLGKPLSDVSAGEWRTLYDALRALDRQLAQEQFGPHESNEIDLKIFKLPAWYAKKVWYNGHSVWVKLGYAVLLSLPALAHVAYHVLYAFLYGFYHKPMAYEWFGQGAGNVSKEQIQNALERTAQSLRSERPSRSMETGWMWQARYLWDKTVLFKSTWEFLRRRVHMGLLHYAISHYLPMTQLQAVPVLGWQIAGMHPLLMLVSPFLMSAALSLGSTVRTYAKAYALQNRTLNLFLLPNASPSATANGPPGALPAPAEFSLKALKDYLDSLRARNTEAPLSQDQAIEIGTKLRQMQAQGLYYSTGLMGLVGRPTGLVDWFIRSFGPEAGEKQRIDDLIYQFEKDHSLIDNAQYALAGRQPEPHYQAWADVYREAIYRTLALIATLGTLGHWIALLEKLGLSRASSLSGLDRQLGASLIWGTFGMLTVEYEIEGATWLGKSLGGLTRVNAFPTVVDVSENIMLRAGNGVLGFTGLDVNMYTERSASLIAYLNTSVISEKERMSTRMALYRLQQEQGSTYTVRDLSNWVAAKVAGAMSTNKAMADVPPAAGSEPNPLSRSPSPLEGEGVRVRGPERGGEGLNQGTPSPPSSPPKGGKVKNAETAANPNEAKQAGPGAPYTVVPGDNLSGIAQRTGHGNWRTTIDLVKSGIKDPNRIWPGQQIFFTGPVAAADAAVKAMVGPPAPATVVGANAPMIPITDIVPNTTREIKNQDGVLTKSTGKKFPQFKEYELDLRKGLAVGLAGAPAQEGKAPVLAVEVQTDAHKGREPLRTFANLQDLLKLSVEGRILIYRNPGADERPDALGRGRLVTSEEEKQEFYDDQKSYQTWVKEDDGQEYPLISGTSLADLLVTRAASYQRGRKVLDEVLNNTSLPDKVVPTYNPDIKEVVETRAIGAVVPKGDDRQPINGAVYFQESQLTPLAPKGSPNSIRGEPYLRLPGGFDAKLVFYAYGTSGELVPVTELRGKALDAPADKILLQHVRNGILLHEGGPGYNDPWLWDEVVFGKNARNADLAETLIGRAEHDIEVKNAEKARDLVYERIFLEAVKLGLNVGGGLAAFPVTPIITNGLELSVGSVLGLHALPDTVDEKSAKQSMKDYFKRQNPAMMDAQAGEQANNLWNLGQQNPELMWVFTASREFKEHSYADFLIRLATNANNAVASVKDYRDYQKIKGLQDKFQFLAHHIVNLDPKVWSTALTKMTQGQRDEFVHIMGRNFDFARLTPGDVKYILDKSATLKDTQDIVFLFGSSPTKPGVLSPIGTAPLNAEGTFRLTESIIAMNEAALKSSLVQDIARSPFGWDTSILGAMGKFFGITDGGRQLGNPVNLDTSFLYHHFQGIDVVNAFGVTVNLASFLHTLTDNDCFRVLTGRQGGLFPESPGIENGYAYQIYFLGFPVKIFAAHGELADYVRTSKAFAIKIEEADGPQPLKFVKQIFGRRHFRELTEEEFDNLKLQPMGVVTHYVKGQAQQTRAPFYVDEDGNMVILGDKAYTTRADRLLKEMKRFEDYQKLQSQGGAQMVYEDSPGSRLNNAQDKKYGVAATPRDAVTLALNAENPLTRLPPSHLHADGGPENAAYSYDLADLMIREMETGYGSQAYDLAMRLANENWAWRDGGIINAFDTASEKGRALEPAVTAGPNDEMGVALLRVRDAALKGVLPAGDPKILDRLLERAKGIGDFEVRLQEKDGHIRHGLAEKDQDTASVEENLRSYAFLKTLSQVTGEKKYDKAAKNILPWLSTMYDRGQGGFYEGISPDMFYDGITQSVVNPTFVTDANALALIVLGPEVLDGVGQDGRYLFEGPGTAKKVLDSLERARVALPEVMLPNGQIARDVSGYDFTDAAGRERSGHREPLISPEWTQHAALAKLVMAARWKNVDPERARRLISEAEQLRSELDKVNILSKEGAGIPYAVGPDWIAKDITPYPDARYKTPSAAASLAGRWDFPELAINPYRLDRGLTEALASLGYAPDARAAHVPDAAPRQLSPEEKDRLLHPDFKVGDEALTAQWKFYAAVVDEHIPGAKLVQSRDPRTDTYVYFDRNLGQNVRVTLVSSPEKMQKDMARKEKEQGDARRIAEVALKGGVIINNEKGQLDKIDVGMDQVYKVMDEVLKLPWNQQSEIVDNHWMFSRDPGGRIIPARPGAAFSILKFPANDNHVPRMMKNPLTGKPELRTYVHGLLTQSASDTAITVVTNTDYGIEKLSDTYQNLGTPEHPKRGPKLYHTDTVNYIDSENWKDRRLIKDVTYPELHRHELQVYGGAPLPLAVITDQFVTVNRFDDDGHIIGSDSYLNDGHAAVDPKTGEVLWKQGEEEIVSRRIGWVDDRDHAKGAIFEHEDRKTHMVWETAQDELGRTTARYDGHMVKSLFVPEIEALGHFSPGALGFLGVNEGTETYQIVPKDAPSAMAGTRKPVSLPGVAGEYELVDQPIGRSKLIPLGKDRNGQSYYYDEKGNHKVERHDLVLGDPKKDGITWYEWHDQYGREIKELRGPWTLEFQYNGMSNLKKNTVLYKTQDGNRTKVARWDYQAFIPVKDAGLNISPDDKATAGLTDDDRVQLVHMQTAWGYEETAFNSVNPYGRAPVTLLPGNQMRVVDAWLPGTNMVVNSRVLDSNNRLLKRYHADLKYLDDYLSDKQSGQNGINLRQQLEGCSVADIREYGADGTLQTARTGFFNFLNIANLKTGGLDVIRYDTHKPWIKDGQDTYEVVDRQIGNKILTSYRDTWDIAPLIRWLKDYGYGQTAQSLDQGNYEIYRMQELAADQSTVVNEWESAVISNTDKEPLQYNPRQSRLSVNLYDPSDFKLGGAVYHYQPDPDKPGEAPTELLSLSVVLPHPEEKLKDTSIIPLETAVSPTPFGPDEFLPVFVLNREMKVGFLEHRSKIDGAVLASDEGIYNENSPMTEEKILQLEKYLQQAHWQDFQDGIHQNWTPVSRTTKKYDRFEDYSGVHLRRLGAPFQSWTYGRENPKDPEIKKFDENHSSRSQLMRLAVRPYSLWVESFKEDRIPLDLIHPDDRLNIPGYGRLAPDELQNNIPTNATIEVQNERGQKVETWFGETTAEPSAPLEEKYRQFSKQMGFRLFYFDDEPHLPHYGKYDVADKSLVTIVSDGKEYLHSFSNSVTLRPENGHVLYMTQQGWTENPIDVVYPELQGLTNGEQYRLLRDISSGDGHQKLKLDAVSMSYGEEKDPFGHFKLMLHAYAPDQIGPEGFIKTEDASRWMPSFVLNMIYVNYLNYTTFHIGIADMASDQPVARTALEQRIKRIKRDPSLNSDQRAIQLRSLGEEAIESALKRPSRADFIFNKLRLMKDASGKLHLMMYYAIQDWEGPDRDQRLRLDGRPYQNNVQTTHAGQDYDRVVNFDEFSFPVSHFYPPTHNNWDKDLAIKRLGENETLKAPSRYGKTLPVQNILFSRYPGFSLAVEMDPSENPSASASRPIISDGNPYDELRHQATPYSAFLVFNGESIAIKAGRNVRYFRDPNNLSERKGTFWRVRNEVGFNNHFARIINPSTQAREKGFALVYLIFGLAVTVGAFFWAFLIRAVGGGWLKYVYRDLKETIHAWRSGQPRSKKETRIGPASILRALFDLYKRLGFLWAMRTILLKIFLPVAVVGLLLSYAYGYILFTDIYFPPPSLLDYSYDHFQLLIRHIGSLMISVHQLFLSAIQWVRPGGHSGTVLSGGIAATGFIGFTFKAWKSPEKVDINSADRQSLERMLDPRLVDRILVHRAHMGPLVLTAAEELREDPPQRARLEQYLSLVFGSPDDASRVIEFIEKGELISNPDSGDPYDGARAPPLSYLEMALHNRFDLTNIPGEVREALQSSPSFLALKELYDKFPALHDGIAADLELEKQRLHSKYLEDSLGWNDLLLKETARVQDLSLENIRNATRLDDLKSLAARLPLTSEALMFRYLVENPGRLDTLLGKKGAKPGDTLLELIQKNKNSPQFTLFVLDLVRDIARTKAEAVLDQFLQNEPKISEKMGDRKKQVIEMVVNDVDPTLFRNPAAAFEQEGDIYLSTLSDEFQTRTLTERTIEHFLMLHPSDTVYYSFGQMSVLGTTLTYLARQAARMLQEQNKKNYPEGDKKPINRIHDVIHFVIPFMLAEDEEFRKITERAATVEQQKMLSQVFVEGDMLDLFALLTRRPIDLWNPQDVTANFKNTLSVLNTPAMRRYGVPGTPEEDFMGYLSELIAERNSARDEGDLDALANALKADTLEMVYQEVPAMRPRETRMGRLLEMIIPRAGRAGFLELYRRAGIVFTRPDLFWGIQGRKKWRAVAATIGAFLFLGLVASPYNITSLASPLSLVLLAQATFLPFLLFGKAKRQEKVFWITVFEAFSIFYFGILFDMMIPAALSKMPFWFTMGTVFSLTVYLSVGLATFLAVYYPVAMLMRGYRNLHGELWSKTARETLGRRAWVPFKSIFGLGWEALLARWYQEFKEVEKSFGPIMPQGESVTQYLERLIHNLHANQLMDAEELNHWHLALQGDPAGRFDVPKSSRAQEILWEAFMALSVKKPSVDTLTRLVGMTSDLHSAGERFLLTWESAARLGVFDPIKNKEERDKKGEEEKDIKTSLLGYLAYHNKVEWRNLVHALREAYGNVRSKDGQASEAMDKLIHRLAGDHGEDEVNDASPIFDWANELSANGKSAMDSIFMPDLISMVEDWLKVMILQDEAALESFASDHAEEHLYFAHQLGDWSYWRAARQALLEFHSLGRTYKKLEVIDKKLKGSKEISPEDETLFKKHSVFYKNYRKYQDLVESKHQLIYQDVTMWMGDGADIQIDKVGKFKKFVSPDGFRDIVSLSKDPNIAPLQISLKDNEDLFKGYKKSEPIQWAVQFLIWREATMPILMKIDDDEVWAQLDKLTQRARMYAAAQECHAYVATYDASDSFIAQKNPAIASNRWRMFGKSSGHDSFMRIYPGQNPWTLSALTLMGRDPTLAALLPPIKISAAGAYFPVTRNYAAGQESWTFAVQAAWRNYLTYYGKGISDPAIVLLFQTPGEDSGSFIKMKMFQPRFRSTHASYRMQEWARPSFTTTVVNTEMRYAYNVSRFLMDDSLFRIFLMPDIGYDVKLSMLILFLHYLIAPFVIASTFILLSISMMSAYGFLPVILFGIIFYFSTQSINWFNVLRHLVQTGSVWKAAGLTLRDVFLGFAMWVFMFPVFLQGLWNAAHERYSYIRTEKRITLQEFIKKNREQVYSKVMIWSAITGWVGIGLILFFFMQVMAFGSFFALPIMLIYLYLMNAFISGILVYGAYLDRSGRLKGMKGWAFLGYIWSGFWFSLNTTSESIPPKLFKFIQKKVEALQPPPLNHVGDADYEKRMVQVLKDAREDKDANGDNRLKPVELKPVKGIHGVLIDVDDVKDVAVPVDQVLEVRKRADEVFLWQGKDTKSGYPTTHWGHADIENGIIYFAEGNYDYEGLNDLVLQQEAFELYRWRQRAMEVAGLSGSWTDLKKREQRRAMRALLRYREGHPDEFNERGKAIYSESMKVYGKEIAELVSSRPEHEELIKDLKKIWEDYVIDITAKRVSEGMRKEAIEAEIQDTWEMLRLNPWWAKKNIKDVQDFINALRINDQRVKYDENRFGKGEVNTLDQWLQGLPPEKRAALEKKANGLVLEGRLAPHFLFGGAGTRLGLGAMYFASVPELAKKLVEMREMVSAEPLTFEQEQILSSFKSSVPLQTKQERDEKEARQFLDDLIPENMPEEQKKLLYETTRIGPLQIIMFRLQLEKMVREKAAKDFGPEPKGEQAKIDYQKKVDAEIEKVLKGQILVIHVNSAILHRVAEDLQAHNFYGFSRDNVYLLPSPVLHGAKLGKKQGEFCIDLNSGRLPVGHLQAFEQFFKEKQAYQVDGSGELRKDETGKTLQQVLDGKGVKLVSAQRVNNLKMWTPTVLDQTSIMFALDHPTGDVFVTLVANPGGQKGGTFIRDKQGHEYLIETLAIEDEDVRGFQDWAGQENLPYNEFTNLYRLGQIANKMTDAEGNLAKLRRYMKYELKAADRGAVRTDSVTGDVTQFATQFTKLLNYAFRRTSGDKINDFKEMKNLIAALEVVKNALEALGLIKKANSPTGTTSASPVGVKGSKKAGVVSALASALTTLITVLALHLLHAGGSVAIGLLAAGFVPAIGMILVSRFFARQSSRIEWAKERGVTRAGPHNVIEGFDDPFLFPDLNDPDYFGPEQIEMYRHEIAFVLRVQSQKVASSLAGKIVIDKQAIGQLTLEEQRSILRHELAHLGFHSVEEYRAYVLALNAGQVAPRLPRSEFTAYFIQACYLFKDYYGPVLSELNRSLLPTQSPVKRIAPKTHHRIGSSA